MKKQIQCLGLVLYAWRFFPLSFSPSPNKWKQQRKWLFLYPVLWSLFSSYLNISTLLKKGKRKIRHSIGLSFHPSGLVFQGPLYWRGNKAAGNWILSQSDGFQFPWLMQSSSYLSALNFPFYFSDDFSTSPLTIFSQFTE